MPRCRGAGWWAGPVCTDTDCAHRGSLGFPGRFDVVRRRRRKLLCPFQREVHGQSGEVDLRRGNGNAVSYGLNITLSKLSLASCVVWGGSANSSYGIGLYSSMGSTVTASTILGGKGSSAWAVYLSESDPEIVNCLIGATEKTKSCGVFVNCGQSRPRALRANAFLGSASGKLSGVGWEKVSAEPDGGGAFPDAPRQTTFR